MKCLRTSILLNTSGRFLLYFWINLMRFLNEHLYFFFSFMTICRQKIQPKDLLAPSGYVTNKKNFQFDWLRKIKKGSV